MGPWPSIHNRVYSTVNDYVKRKYLEGLFKSIQFSLNPDTLLICFHYVDENVVTFVGGPYNVGGPGPAPVDPCVNPLQQLPRQEQCCGSVVCCKSRQPQC